jgi:hypothetical protein
MKEKATPLVDEHLRSLEGMKEAGTDEFFYTRLKARMEKRDDSGWQLSLKPGWVVGVLILLLAVNGIMLSQKGKTSSKEPVSAIQGFAASYDQIVSSYE